MSAWTATFIDDKHKRSVKNHLDRFVPMILTFTREHSSPTSSSPVNASKTFIKLYDGFFASLDSKQDKSANQLSEKAFIFCALWAFAGCLDATDREKICSNLKTPLLHLCLMPSLAHGDTYFDFYVDHATGEWEHWKTRVGEWTFPTDALDQSFSLLLVPTLDGSRFQYLVKTMSFGKNNILVTGTTGCAKSSLVSQYTQTLDRKKITSRTFSMTGASTVDTILKRVESILEKRMGFHYGPLEGKRCIMIVEDLHQAQTDIWGDSPVFELYRQLLCEEGYYKSNSLRDWVRVDDLQHISLSSSSSSSSKLCSRLKNKFSIINLTPLLDSTINSIFSKILGERLSTLGARNSVAEIALTLAQSTVSIWRRLQVLLQPSQEKMHYIFELNDMARVFEGLVRCSGDEMMSAEQVVKVWRHECERSICDKLITVDDQTVAFDTITAMLRAQINKLGQAVSVTGSESFMCHTEEMYGELESEPGVYRPIKDLDTVREKILEAAQHTGNEILVFDEFVRHIIRIHRILCSSRGYVLLVGPCCSGKGSLAQLAGLLSTSIVINLQHEANQDQFHAEQLLKNAYKAAGVQLCTTTLILSNPRDYVLLERINQFARTGYFPDLISNAEFDETVKELRGKIGENEAKSNEALIDRFISRARSSIRIIICSEPDLFRSQWDCFPMLRKNFAIDWLLPRNTENLRSMAREYIESHLEEVGTDTEAASIFLSSVHSTILQFETTNKNIHFHSTPRHFLSLLYTFSKVYKLRIRKLRSRATEIDLGLQKLDFAGDGVAIMKAELEDKDSVLKFSQETTSALLKDISLSTMKTEKKKSEVMSAKNMLVEQVAQLQQLKEEYEQDVASAGPALREAEQAISSISMKELATLRLIKNPPSAVKLVFDCVLIFLRKPLRNFELESNGIKDSYSEGWKLLQDPQFVKTLASFPKTSVNDESLELLAPYLEQKDFAFEKVGSTSLVARSLFQWIRALSHHHELTRAFIPKLRALKLAEENLNAAEKNLGKSVEDLNRCQADLDELQSKFENAIAEKHRLNNHASKVESKISSAEALLHSLEFESVRWKDERLRLKECVKAAVGDCCIASAYLVYLGVKEYPFALLVTAM